jgi:hypothetical protein
MKRVLVMILSTVLVAVSTAWAADLHIEATCDEHATLEKINDGDPLSDRAGHCGHCCHGSAHSVALPLAESKLAALPAVSPALQNDSLVTSLSLAPPTHPPKV